MAKVIAPLLLGWLVAAALAARMLYVLAQQSGFFPYGMLCLALAAVLARSYVLWVQQPRRQEARLCPFQLTLDFTLNRVCLPAYILPAALYLLTDTAQLDARLLTLLTTLCLAVAAGTLTGVLTAESFMQRYNIRRSF